MPLGTFIAGRYSSTYDPAGAGAGVVDVGIVERGYELQISFSKKLITNTDAYADSVIDGVYRGGNVFWQTTMLEYKIGSLNVALPYNDDATNDVFAPTGATFLGPGLVGRLDSNIAGSYVVTSTTGTPAVSTPATLTATLAIIAENFNINLFFGPEERKIPLRLRFLPYSDTFTKWFSTTIIFISSWIAFASFQ